LDEVISRDEQRRLDEILKGLDKNDLELLRLRFAAELTYKQIGDVIGKTEAAAKMSFIRLIQRLRLIWEGKDE
jgi:RNA polymerase sigma factor (sigma-70 family)